MCSRAQLSVCAVAVLCTALVAADTARTPDKFRDDAAAEKELLAAINRERAKAGAQPLQIDARLAAAARAHTHEMVRRRQLNHQFNDEHPLKSRISEGSTAFDALAENVGYAQSAAEVHQLFLHSPHHHENIVASAYDRVGIGAAWAGHDLYVTEDFGASSDPSDEKPQNAEDAEAIVAAAISNFRTAHHLAHAARGSGIQLRSLACNTRQAELPATWDEAKLIAYETSEPTVLPNSVTAALINSELWKFAVGACQTQNGYRILVAAYIE